MSDAPSFRNPTAHDVARLAGVSQSAVSRAFTAGASISPDKREKIIAAADQLGYRPNILARSLIQGTSKVVGVVFGQFENPFFAHALDRFAEEFAARGLRILLFTAKTNATVDEQVAELLSYKVSAVILMAVNLSSKLAAECARSNIPVVMFNRTTEEDHAAFTVTGDNAAGATAIARHFLATGRKRIAYMAGYDDSSTSRQREAAFFAALADSGLPPPRRAIGHYSRHGAIEATRALFASASDQPDALFCANDLMAIAAIETLRAEFGIEPGAQCAVAGFDDIPMASWPSFSLTTYSQPVADMVARAVAFIAGETGEEQAVVVPGKLIVRNSA
ncbi:LacI family DNA-binding transcriptional regulator [Sphingobium subterraneum]|uniref:DNA-binding LacI/PurR family transcriptional regulator n=1 Tax=Sphingobium subterraneum TaxID=627688 RepID=A0A841IWJ3_9SPHN|nr:LacI family DNA-binding transcriptional regulator [Sphingobium subterraneum]MBB6123023.1 DNA-binding LacI/PurR family transcriptional regulator [Sphingobium subterraneum]